MITLRFRSTLDTRFGALKPINMYAAPAKGWISAVREALGMTTAQLAQRLGVKQPSVVAMEQSEAKGTIELATLRRAAEALDCTLIYALVPNRPLDEMVRERARAFIEHQEKAMEHSMLLENQAVPRDPKDMEARVDELLREVNLRRLWD